MADGQPNEESRACSEGKQTRESDMPILFLCLRRGRSNAIDIDVLSRECSQKSRRTTANKTSDLALGVIGRNQEVFGWWNFTTFVARDHRVAIKGQPIFFIAWNADHRDRKLSASKISKRFCD